MPNLLIDPPAATPPPEPPRKRWTRAECAVLEASGLFDGQRLELIEGELINRIGQNPPHIWGVAFLRNWLQTVFGLDRVLQDCPIDVAPGDNPINEPVPD